MQPKTIAEQLFYSTVRIDTVLDDGEQGSGTGFLFSHMVGDRAFPCVVTNRHMITGASEGTLTFIRGSGGWPMLGSGVQFRLSEWPRSWVAHPDPDIDIAICPFAPIEAQIKEKHNVDLYYHHVSSSSIPTLQQFADLDAIESVTFIGYPDGVWDSKNLLPIARRGTTASPIEVDFEGSPKFLIDASVFGGSSGSPVFILNQGAYAMKEGGISLGSRFHFVGVVAAVYFRTQMNQLVSVPIPTQVQQLAQQEEMIDLGIVFKARTVVETIEAYLQARGVDAGR